MKMFGSKNNSQAEYKTYQEEFWIVKGKVLSESHIVSTQRSSFELQQTPVMIYSNRGDLNSAKTPQVLETDLQKESPASTAS